MATAIYTREQERALCGLARTLALHQTARERGVGPHELASRLPIRTAYAYWLEAHALGCGEEADRALNAAREL